MTTEFMTEFKQSIFFNRMITQENVMFAYLMGSRLIGITDEKSDFDIVCFVSDEPKYYDPPEFLTWNGLKVHYYYYPLSVLFKIEHPLHIVTLTQMHRLKENNTLIYLNENFKNIYEQLLFFSDDFLKIGLYALVESQMDLINNVVAIENGILTSECKSKFLYHIIWAKKAYFKETYDINYLKKLKRIRWQKIDSEYHSLCIQDIKELKQFIENNAFDYKSNLKQIEYLF